MDYDEAQEDDDDQEMEQTFQEFTTPTKNQSLLAKNIINSSPQWVNISWIWNFHEKGNQIVIFENSISILFEEMCTKYFWKMAMFRDKIRENGN